MSSLERYDPSVRGRIQYEHFHRYAFASDFVSGAAVLDIASGEGYGSVVLSRSAKSVVGVDIDPRAVEAAQRKYGNTELLQFVVGSADAIPFPDDTFDVLVSLETIEHLPDPAKLLSEARRVIKPDGAVIISSPNKAIYNRYLKQANEFHLSEMQLDEFSELMSAYFENVSFYGQRMMLASSLAPVGILSPKPNTAEYRGFTARSATTRGAKTRGTTIEAGVARLDNPEYYVCIASNGQPPVPSLRDSLFLMASEDLWEEHAKIMAWASGLHDEDEQLRARLQDLQDAQAKHEQSLALALADARAASLAELLAAREGELNRVQVANQAADVALLAPILSDITDGPVGGDLGAVIHGLTRAAVRTAVYKHQVAELTAAATASRQAEAVQAERARESARLAQDAQERLRQAEAAQAELTAAATASRQAEAVQAELARESARLAQDAQERLRQAEAAQDALRSKNTSLLGEVRARENALRTADETLAAHRSPLAFAATSAIARSTYGTIDRLHREFVQQREWGRANAKVVKTPQEAHVSLMVTNAAFAAFEKTGLFMPDYYARVANVPADLRTAWKHFRTRGCIKGIDCNPLLHTGWMHTLHPALSGHSASFVAVVAPGRYEQAMHPLFDPEHYQAYNQLTLAPTDSALQHYMREGRHAGLATHPMIDLRHWRAHAPDGRAFDLIRYLTDPACFRASVHPFFDADFYLDANRDVAASGINPLLHYYLDGWREGRDPNPLFDSQWYLATYPDVAQMGMIPLDHYVRHGAMEGRQPHPLFSPSYYMAQHQDVVAAGLEPYTHYLEYGRREGRLPAPQIAELAGCLPDVPREQLVDVIRDGRVNISSLLAATAWGEAPGEHAQWGVEQAYYLPQKLRDYIIDRFGEDDIDFYVGLFGIVDRFAERASAFDTEYDVAGFASRLGRLSRLRHNPKPAVSIVIPVYNNLVYTLTCIASILESSSAYPFEIIVADDRSSDRTAEIVSRIGGAVTHLRHENNLGFLRNCNAAADIALGDYLVFLNNDTIVLPGWLDGLVAPLVADPRIGLTGSKLLNGDGTLQEAGGIIWSDGSAWNYGRNQEPWLPEFNYVKDVDYISGASIAFPRSVWRELGGFDLHFEPAYCEDSDIAFRARAAGYRTVYQPRSMVVHHEGRSHGRDLSSGIKAKQVINQAKFFARWKTVLERDHLLNGQDVFVARDRSTTRPHILFIDHYVPQWDQDAGSRTIYDYLRTFAESGFQVSFWSDNLYEDRHYTYQLQQLGIEVIYSRAYLDRYSEWMAENAAHVDYLFFSRPHITRNYIEQSAKYSEIKKIYYGHDLHFRRMLKEYEIKNDPALLEEAKGWEALEIGICCQVDLVLYPSMEEVDVIRLRVPSHVSVQMLPMNVLSDDLLDRGAAAAVENSADRRKQIMFIGGFSHTPNKDGIVWVIRNVMPLVRDAEPGVKLLIAGSNTTDDIRALAASDIEILGRISDETLADLYRGSALSIAPLRYGGGVKGKVIEAMAAGVPVVTTTIGVQGMANARTFAFVADDPQDFADAIVRVIHAPDEAAARAVRAVDFLRDTYSKDAVRRRLSQEIPEFANNPT